MSKGSNILREALAEVPAGPLVGDMASKVESLLIGCWDEFEGSSTENTTGDKLIGRIEKLEWQPPNLTFRIERHGATVMGSSRATLQRWNVDIEARNATVATSG